MFRDVSGGTAASRAPPGTAYSDPSPSTGGTVDVDSISTLRSPSGALVSLTINHSGASSALLTDLLKPIRARAEGMSHEVSVSVRADADRISALAPHMDASPAPGFAVYASTLDGVFRFEELPESVWDAATVGSRPLVRPLRTIPAPLRLGLLVADRATAWTYVDAGEGVAPLAPRVTGDPGKSNYGGFAGYEEQGVRARADEEAVRVWREAAGRLFEAHRDSPFDGIMVGGHRETTDAIAAELHPYLRRLPLERFVVDPHTMTAPELSKVAAAYGSKLRLDREHALVRNVSEELEKGGWAVSGTSAVLEAVNAHAIDHLVVAGPFSRPGVACRSCGWLARVGARCAVCGSDVEEVDDVVAEAIEAVLGSGGKADQVSVASRVDADGVAAILRFPV
jgi:hypothetical protein